MQVQGQEEQKSARVKETHRKRDKSRAMICASLTAECQSKATTLNHQREQGKRRRE